MVMNLIEKVTFELGCRGIDYFMVEPMLKRHWVKNLVTRHV